MAADIKRFRDQIQSRKVYVLGEFGFIPPSGIEKVLNAVISEGLSGAMIWSLRFHNRDGGFYWHSEPASASLYNPYHYPGFPSGEGWNETATLKVMRTKAFEIQGLKLAGMEVPAPPNLLPIRSPAEISWQGSVGASNYDIERAETSGGTWSVVGKDVDDTWVRYRPLFSDLTTQVGQSYYYRLRAKNMSGVSVPSNVVGPVKVTERWLVDEMLDFSKVFAHEGTLTLESANARPYKEDPHRAKGATGASLVYRTTGSIHSASILTLMEGPEKEFEFYASNDGKAFQKLTPKVSRYGSEANLYGYKLPVKYELEFPPESFYLRIAFAGDAQISRVELRYGR